MILRILCLVGCACSFIGDVSGIQCRSGWFNHADSCYHFSHDKEDWTSAETICERFDAILTEIETDVEDRFLQSIIDHLGVNFWVGGTDLEEEGVWKWMNSGVLVNYTNWAPGEPNSSNNQDENCIDLRPHKNGWNDERCWMVQNYICEITESETPGIIG